MVLSTRLYNKSKFLSLVLRHKPEKVGLRLDRNGWAETSDILLKLGMSEAELHEIVISNDKQRFGFNDTCSKIRANQGHTIDITLDLIPIVPPDILYHGTVQKFIPFIKEKGLQKQKRNHLHLSADYETALAVGKRRGTPVILEVAAGKMGNEGYVFYLSENGVWLTEEVPTRHIRFP